MPILFVCFADEMAIVDKFATVSAEYVGKHAYIGVQTDIGPKSIIGDSAVINAAVVLPSHVIVLAAEIVARTPTSMYFYRQCHDFILNDKYVVQTTNDPLLILIHSSIFFVF